MLCFKKSKLYLAIAAIGYIWRCHAWTPGIPPTRSEPPSPPTASVDELMPPELFSVAPMMGHTNRHYRYFFGLLSRKAWLYTEMIPANRIIQNFLAAGSKMGIEVPNGKALAAEQINETAEAIRFQSERGLLQTNDFVLEELLNSGPNAAVLQLGGRDPESLATASMIGAAFGYEAINLNCGCPSTSVSARSTGAALMREPEIVARCLEAMSEGMERVSPKTILSVKHRLGVADFANYDAAKDHAKGDDEAFQTCRDFVREVTGASKVSRIQVHARLALLRMDQHNNEGEERRHASLWTPTSIEASATETLQEGPVKVNHQRAQYQAKRRARQVTLQNRSVPPLRPRAVEEIANEFQHLQIVSNGGIDSMEEIHNRISDTAVTGAMVGRTVINHPCAFAAVDNSLCGHESTSDISNRRHVLLRYIDYCEAEENRLKEILAKLNIEYYSGNRRNDEDSIAWHRRRLVAPAFHLFMGEIGNESYQRRLRKLVDRADRHSAHSMLLAAMAEVPSETLDKALQDHVAWQDIPKYTFAKLAGAMQRTIYCIE